MGLTDNKRLMPSIYLNSGTGSSSGGNAFSDGPRGINLSGGTDPCSERGNLLIKRPSGRFCLPTISGPQKGWWVPPSSELEGPEQVHPRGALQDGRVPHGERSGETGRLVSKNRFERCLFPNPGTSLSPEVSPVYLEGKSVPVPVPSIRTLMYPRVFTKVTKPVVAFLRERGIKLIIYLDDLLIISSCPEILLAQINLIQDCSRY